MFSANRRAAELSWVELVAFNTTLDISETNVPRNLLQNVERRWRLFRRRCDLVSRRMVVVMTETRQLDIIHKFRRSIAKMLRSFQDRIKASACKIQPPLDELL